jgi:ATP-binding cassette subfamily F protein 3
LRAHLGAFLFTGDEVDKRIGVLSGGEKARVALAKLLLRPANLMILDEPTNHLDIEACEVLEEALRSYPGTLLFVSHDRAFINALATRVVEVDHGRLESSLGDYDAYLERRQRRLESRAANEPEAPSPSRNQVAPRATRSTLRPPTAAKQARMQDREQRKTRERTARQIEKLEERIAEEEKRQEALSWQLSEPEVYRDPERSRALRAEQAELAQSIETLYGAWEQACEALAELDVLLSR